MALRVYEGMFLLDANRYSRDPGAVSGRIGEMIEKVGGEVLAARLWAEQKLAYRIDGHRKGAYWLTYFRVESGKLVELRRASQLNNDILRELIVSVDERLVETLVEHAKSGGRAKPVETSDATSSVVVAVAAGNEDEGSS